MEYPMPVVLQQYVRDVLHPAAADQENILIHVVVEVAGDAAAAMHLGAQVTGECSIRHAARQVRK